MYVILINGHACALKTSLAYALSPRIGFALVSTSTLGEFTSDRDDQNFNHLRMLRYKKMKSVLDCYLKSNVSVILDANFPLKKLRAEFLDLAEARGVIDVISIHCFCNDLDVLKKRFNYRLNNKSTPDSYANTLDAYYGSVSEYEPIIKDRFKLKKLSSISFDSGSFELKIENDNGFITERVFLLISQIIQDGILEDPIF